MKYSDITKIWKRYSILMAFHNKFSCNIISGNPVQVDINMYVRSMGPISEMDMVGALNDVILFILQSINIKSTLQHVQCMKTSHLQQFLTYCIALNDQCFCKTIANNILHWVLFAFLL